MTKRALWTMAAILLLTAAPTVSAAAQDIERVNAAKAAEIARTTPGVVILDLRTPDEFNSGHLPNAKNIDFYKADFKTRIASLDRNATYLVYCRSGRRSGVTLDFLRDVGFGRVYHLDGGVIAWRAPGCPCTDRASLP